MELVDKSGTIHLTYTAKTINIVAGSQEPTTLTLLLDGKEYRTVTIKDFDLYTLVNESEYGTHDIEIRAAKGLMAYTFTFG